MTDYPKTPLISQPFIFCDFMLYSAYILSQRGGRESAYKGGVLLSKFLLKWAQVRLIILSQRWGVGLKGGIGLSERFYGNRQLAR